MKKDRRSFIISGGMAAGTALISGVSAHETISAAGSFEEQAERLVSSFGKVVSREKAKGGILQLNAGRIDHRRMVLLLSNQKRLPFDGIRVNPGGDLEIRQGNQQIRVTSFS